MPQWAAASPKSPWRASIQPDHTLQAHIHVQVQLLQMPQKKVSEPMTSHLTKLLIFPSTCYPDDMIWYDSLTLALNCESSDREMVSALAITGMMFTWTMEEEAEWVLAWCLYMPGVMDINSTHCTFFSNSFIHTRSRDLILCCVCVCMC